MKKVGIVTIIDNDNYGNRLQNYAVQHILETMDIQSETIKNTKLNRKKFIKRKMKHYLLLIYKKNYRKRYMRFKKFNRNINFSKSCSDLKKINIKKIESYDYFLVGSDQVWNPNFGRLNSIDLLTFVSPNKRISFSASFGIDYLDEKYKNIAKKELSQFKSISVREDFGKQIVEDLTQRDDVEILVDPTMLLDSAEWEKLAKKPKKLNDKKYILCYFLGELSKEKQDEIDRLSKENNYEIINLMDKKSKFYSTGPSEFLYLEKNAELICTDSFHSSIFAILFNKPFIVFEREQKGVQSMNSRIDTLISKLELKNRKFKDKITDENLNHNYSKAYKLLEIERNKAKDFLIRNLEIEK